MIEPTRIQLPPSLLYPVEITGILAQSGGKIKKHGPILRYKYWNTVEEGVGQDERDQGRKVRKEFHSTFESPIEGEVQQWFVGTGDHVTDANTPVVAIVEPCTHPVQYAGLCAICGEPLDEKDYTEFDNNSRAPITMSHDTSGLKVSYNEAERIEKSSSERLLSDKKLILVVDLDQTVIHAAVDPTIGEWMRDENNPNYEALKDVQTFSLEEEIPVPPTFEGKPPITTCWYYVKLRPGLKQFLESINNLYEMHIYTMATKSYAKAIAKIIDPQGKYFGDRILSRDESGSLVQKNLKRLFPVSTSMVAVIDDRGDVWRWSSNLIKVVPYNFFVGIGDINSSFLPQRGIVVAPSEGIERERKDEDVIKQNGVGDGDGNGNGNIDQSPEVEDVEVTGQISEEVNKKNDDSDEPNESESLDTVEQLVQMGGEDSPDLLTAQASRRSASIEQQQQERPLAKLQKELESKADASVRQGAHLLSDKDSELLTVEMALRMIHKAFYDEYAEQQGKKQQQPDTTQIANHKVASPDLAQIIPSLKREVFKGCVVLFSGILPLGTNLDSADIVQWIRGFGAKVVDDLTPEVTHVVAAWAGTAKVRRAGAMPHVKIVYRDWLFACLAAWKRVPEEPYLIRVDQPLPEEDTTAGGTESATDPIDPEEFMKSLSGGEVDWDEVNKEVDEFLDSDDDEDEEDEDNEREDGDSERDKDLSANGSLKRSRDGGDDSWTELKRPKPDEGDSDDSLDDDDEFLKELEHDLM